MQNRPHFRFFKRQNVNVQEVTEQALRQEWGSLDLNVVVVEDMDAAIAHIREYGTQHSESILTENQRLATQFINQVDAAAVYVECKYSIYRWRTIWFRRRSGGKYSKTSRSRPNGIRSLNQL